MTSPRRFDIFLATAPGLEDVLCAEVRSKGFNSPRAVPGGVTVKGGWPEVWRANLWVRGAGRVLAVLASFRALHLDELRLQARKVAWGEVLRADVPFRVEATCAKSRIYHSGAAAERVEAAIRQALGAPSSPEAPVLVRVRIERDLATLAVDTSGEPLHKRGYKQAVAKAPMRETMASLFLRQCGFDGDEPILDPMCGSGTFVIEAAEMAARLNPGRARRFAFEHLATFDAAAWARMRDVASRRSPPASVRFYGGDRDAGAVAMAEANAERAGVADLTEFRQRTRRAAGSRHRQPALRRPHRRRQEAAAALSRPGAGADRPLPRLARRPHHQRARAGPCHRPALPAARRPRPAWRPAGHAVPDRGVAVTGCRWCQTLRV
jgi:putative N6-adenine-specific DNA methylase